jgi:hypothetical protein
MSYTRLSGPLQFDEDSERTPAPTTVPRNLPAAVVTWLAMLPADVRPMRTAHRFPHVVRQLAQLWDDPERLFDCFEDLLYDNRGKRMGFPTSVLTELESLRTVAKLPPPKPDSIVVDPIAVNPSAAPEATEPADHNGFRSIKVRTRAEPQPPLEFSSASTATKKPDPPAEKTPEMPSDPFGVRGETSKI